ncbi:MAG: hypothetical protein AB7D47_09825 [Desulfovibrio sp.]
MFNQNLVEETIANVEIHEEVNEQMAEESIPELDEEVDTTEDEAAEVPAEGEDEANAEEDSDTETEEETKKERTRKVSESQKEKFAKEKAEDYDEDYDGEPVIDSSDLCERFTITKSVAKDVYLMLAQMLFEKTGQFFKWNDDEPAPNSDNPYINHKGTIVISKAALDSMPSFTTWKEGKTKFVVAEKDGIITMTPIQ